MKYLLDTDHISFLQRRNSSEFARLTFRISQYPIKHFALSIVSFHEQTLGCHNLINRAKINTDILRGYNLLSEILKGFITAPVLPFDSRAILIFEQMREQKISVATMDLRIASIALSHNLILLTRNVKDFSKVPNLITEDWTI
jgi:tRNA(fMet)-specific endonuclease VapC